MAKSTEEAPKLPPGYYFNQSFDPRPLTIGERRVMVEPGQDNGLDLSEVDLADRRNREFVRRWFVKGRRKAKAKAEETSG